MCGGGCHAGEREVMITSFTGQAKVFKGLSFGMDGVWVDVT